MSSGHVPAIMPWCCVSMKNRDCSRPHTALVADAAGPNRAPHAYLFAALDAQSGQVIGTAAIGRLSSVPRSDQAAVPPDRDVHLILDNYSKTPLIHRWLTYSSWLNLVEPELTTKHAVGRIGACGGWRPPSGSRHQQCRRQAVRGRKAPMRSWRAFSTHPGRANCPRTSGAQPRRDCRARPRAARAASLGGLPRACRDRACPQRRARSLPSTLYRDGVQNRTFLGRADTRRFAESANSSRPNVPTR